MEFLTLKTLLVLVIGQQSLADPGCPSHSLPYCVKGCQETNDLLSDLESAGLTDTTKLLIQNTLDSRSCGEKSDGKYCCSLKPRIQPLVEAECKLILRLADWIFKLIAYVSIFLLGECGKSEQSLRMIAGGNGQAIGKVSTVKPWNSGLLHQSEFFHYCEVFHYFEG